MNYWQTHEPSLANVLTHKKCIEMNEGMSHLPVHLGLTLIYFYTSKEVGDRATLAKIQQAKEDDPLYHSMGEKECKDAIDDLIAYQWGVEFQCLCYQQGSCQGHIFQNGKDWVRGKITLCVIHWVFSLTNLTVQDSPFMYWHWVLCHSYVAQCWWHDWSFVAWIWGCCYFLHQYPWDKHMGYLEIIWAIVLLQKIW